MTEPARMAAALCALACLTFAARARADELPPPPAKCPPGQVGVTGRSGARCVEAAPDSCPNGLKPTAGYDQPTCRPWLCAADGECGAGAKCVEHEVCLVPRGQTPGPSDEPRGLCDAGARCESPAYCGPARVCMQQGAEPGAPVATPKRASCKGCATAGGGSPALGFAALAGLVLAAGARRRGRRRQ